jgi:hypothetical protein
VGVTGLLQLGRDCKGKDQSTREDYSEYNLKILWSAHCAVLVLV